MSETFRRWYERNKDEFNSARKARYNSDPEYRQKVIEYARTSRQRAKVRPKPPKKFYSISETAERASTTSTAIRYWESKGFFPRPDTGTVRRYTLHEAELVQFFFTELPRIHLLFQTKELSHAQYDAELEAVANNIKKSWFDGNQNS
jgi:hypothetical protein